ncbi:MAG TPA: hypothetical protein VN634_05365 [Candidatus Limnocylindrales bacterium]|nr:hypothetical protein [Candidatus Limnocylindrales bacterium]
MRISIPIVLVTTLFAFGAAPAAVAALGDCGQPQSTGNGPKTADALAALKKAVGSPSACDAKPCICDVDGSGTVTTTDALRLLRAAVGQSVELSCSCVEECTLLSGVQAVGSTSFPRLDAPPKQVDIDVRIVAVDKDFIKNAGLSFALATPLVSAVPTPGGTNGEGKTLAVSSNATGGPPDLDYLLYANHRPEGALPVLNKNFVSPFTAVKTFFPLPTTGCVEFEPSDVTEPQGFPGVTPVENVPAGNAVFTGGQIVYDVLSPSAAASLLTTIQNDNRNKVLTAPRVVVYSGQTVFHMVDDITASTNQIAEEYRTRVQAVTQNPFGTFTGVALDITPIIGIDGNMTMDVRPESKLLSFFFSTAFTVKGTQVDAEIPVHGRGMNVASMAIPAGQTLVVGGIIRQGQQTAEIGLPVLGQVPLVGSLFTHKQVDPQKQNLIMFVTPTIVTPE